MMFMSTILAVLGLAMFANAHVKMNTPVPFGLSTLNNSPLDPNGADFPCKQRSGVYAVEGASNSMALGSTQPLAFTGSAVHGGGSCQISITYDKEPTKSSVFKVIHSIVGGCPLQGVAGNNGDDANAPAGTYSFTIPDSLPTGEATLAWTWFNKVGNREMYMNCAPITITGGSSKRDNEFETRNATQIMERDISAFNALPNMFVANIPNSQCGTSEGGDLMFPAANLGDSVEFLGGSTSTQTLAPTGACAAAAGAPAATAPADTPASAPAPTLTGGVFATVAPAPTTLVTSPAAPTAAAPSAESPVASAAPSAPATPVPAPAPATGSGDALSGPCTTEGTWNCIGGTSFQQCASGTWSVVQPLAAGTKCAAGQSAAIDITAIKEKREPAIRFSNAHVRRHIHGSHV